MEKCYRLEVKLISGLKLPIPNHAALSYNHIYIHLSKLLILTFVDLIILVLFTSLYPMYKMILVVFKC